MADDWGPWIDHDGKGCPVPVGTVVLAFMEGLRGEFYIATGRVGDTDGESWVWSNWGVIGPDGAPIAVIRRYRVRKPRGLRQLQQLVADPGGPAVPDIAPDRVPETTP